MIPAIEVEELSKHYGPVHALAGVSLEIAPGEFFGLLGPNGAYRIALKDYLEVEGLMGELRADFSPGLSMAIVAACFFALSLVTLWLLRSGYTLRR